MCIEPVDRQNTYDDDVLGNYTLPRTSDHSNLADLCKRVLKLAKFDYELCNSI